MKYYGLVYEGNSHTYDTDGKKMYADPYEALKEANEEWRSNPKKQDARLLLVIRESEEGEEPTIHDKVYFQFADCASCLKFIKNKSAIVWSNETEWKWNGNAKLMRQQYLN